MDYSIYEKECERINKEVDVLKEKYIDMFESYSKRVVRYEIGLGGELLHRGYYCPSLVEDIIVGNAKRGRIAKRTTSKTKKHFVFGFDEYDNLLTVDRAFEKEIITRNGSKEVGIIFSEYGINGVSECYYEDDKLISYAYYLRDDEDGVYEYRKEMYTYALENLYVDWISYSNILIQILEHNSYVFQVKDGYLTSYIIKEFKVDNDSNKVLNCKPFIGNSKLGEEEYQVYVQRKIY